MRLTTSIPTSPSDRSRRIDGGGTRTCRPRAAAAEPFCGLTCHDLRHTAASLMRQAGMPAELVTERLDADGGALLLRTPTATSAPGPRCCRGGRWR